MAEKEKKLSEDSTTVLVGNKSSMSYVLALISQFSRSDKAVVKARGRAISKAVDVVEITRRKFVENLNIDDIRIETEEMSIDDDKKVNVSSIEIYLSKQK